MTGTNVYATNKVIYHPEIVEAFRDHASHKLNPVFVQLMPQNVCNQSCHFCSYRLEDWKNSVMFDESKSIPWDKMQELLDDFDCMDVKAIELTGGGEPLAYKYKKELLKELARYHFETSLVTNGTLLTEEVADLLYETDFKWARISIDSSNSESYSAIRRAPKDHWDKAWAGFGHLVKRRQNQTLGIGFVVTDRNFTQVYELCGVAMEQGANNVRVSMAFMPEGASLLTEGQVRVVIEQIKEAKADFENHKFTIPNVFQERVDNLTLSPRQDYDYCGSKDLLCVIEGEGRVYTCCTHAGSPRGYMGSIHNESFIKLWSSKQEWRKNFDVRKNCDCVCLYEKRNKIMLELRDPPDHLNFI